MFEKLPVDAIVPELLAHLTKGESVVLRAPTGAGKTTRVPPAVLNAKFPGRILVLEPRRLAARAAARRMAQERRQKVGDDIGYHVRFDRQVGPRTRIIVMTPGILMRHLQDDPYLDAVGCVIFDEFHERSLDNDLALGMVRLVQTTVRPDLRMIVMSATLSTRAISDYLGGCPIVTSEGRLFPVTIAYEPRSLQQTWPVAAARAVERVFARRDGDVLCFLPGMQEIRQTARELEALCGTHDMLVLPLHGDLSSEEQDRALLPQERRRVVLATNVAETSVTVEGVASVVDTGVARMLQIDPSVGMDRLELVPIAKDAADQRAGRAGRTGPGECVRLWSEASHQHRPEQTLAEIRRVDLAGALLTLLGLGESDPQTFPWLEPPREQALAQALDLLERLDAVHGGALTDTGRSMARMPVHPRLARLLLEGHRLGHARQVALAAALLSERDPFSRSTEGGRRLRREGSASDVVDRVEAMEAYEAEGTTSFELGTVQVGAARFLLRARDQLLKSLQQEAGLLPARRDPVSSSGEAVARSLLAAYPDRVARRRESDPEKGLMVGGSGVRLAPWSAVKESELFLCIDVDAGPRETLVRMASSLERDWLARERLASKIEVSFDEASERVQAFRRVYYEDLLLEERNATLPAAEEVERILVTAAQANLARVLPEAESAASCFLVRARWLRQWMPELGLPELDNANLLELLPWACAGCRSFEAVRRANWLGLLQSKLTPVQAQAIAREAPESVQVPSGSQITLRYESAGAPVLAVRIQEVFGWHDTPRVAGGRVRLLLHLLAPNYRPQQVTEDLASFWNNIYPSIRKQLRARYPRHAWPEDPLTAPAEQRPRRKSN